ncbi:caspase-14-like [Coregonus clupeaformis]|uniref:caspase-14-like n=1 Tax=Coregonus clupeaformis TaxID=59861 RepID=UPI001E1C59F3|nr:caspase-14-like [Coregonus clupeaformis]
MEKFFKRFGFQYHIVLDKTAQEMKQEVIDFRNGINSSSGDISCVFVVTSSHGHRDVIIGADKKRLPVKDIIEPFGDELCRKMKGKPKIFIIDACRGSNRDTGVIFDSAADEKLSKEAMATKEYRSTRVPPCINDMLVAYAAMTDYVGMMDSTSGSHMIYNISQVFSSPDAAGEHLYNLFVKANAKMVANTVDVTVDEGKPTQRREHANAEMVKRNAPSSRTMVVMTIESTLKRLFYLGRRGDAVCCEVKEKEDEELEWYKREMERLILGLGAFPELEQLVNRKETLQRDSLED